jgi:hypothetical protein
VGFLDTLLDSVDLRYPQLDLERMMSDERVGEVTYVNEEEEGDCAKIKQEGEA